MVPFTIQCAYFLNSKDLGDLVYKWPTPYQIPVHRDYDYSQIQTLVA